MCIALKEKLFNPKPDDISFSLNLQIINYKWSPEADAAINSYSDFLSGNLSVNNIDIDTITLPKGEKNRHYETKYALWDSNGDNIPELHINSSRYYYVFT